MSACLVFFAERRCLAAFELTGVEPAALPLVHWQVDAGNTSVARPFRLDKQRGYCLANAESLPSQ